MSATEKPESALQLHYIESCSSTNALLAIAANKGHAAEGLAYYTFRQTGGYGQQGSNWHTGSDKNIALSILFRPVNLPIRSHFLITQAVSTGVILFLEKFYAPCMIKWPNDIVVASRKIAGILIESAMMGDTFEYAIAGVGININEHDFPTGSPAVSLYQLTGQEYNLELMAMALARSIWKQNKALENNAVSEIKDNFKRQLYGLGKTLKFKMGSEEISGLFEKVDNDGRICVRFGATLQAFQSKEISIILP